MASHEVTAWLETSRSNELAGSELAEHHPRSSVSRLYYAAYSAVHVILLMREMTPPERGNWSHDGLGEVLKAALMRGRDATSDRDATLYRNRVSELYDLRILADYGPLRTVDNLAATRSRRLAGPLVRLAERIVQE